VKRFLVMFLAVGAVALLDQAAGAAASDVLPTQSAAASRAIAAHVLGVKFTPSQACCKVCRKGQACGNSCISRDKTCHQPPGCACQG